ncbi:DUF4239 domain-containing protein [Methyloceanibacter sp.]|uniref:bestrophin-like domain n=1 Tax=Methyloceanibacter sp. TaxID=1965321 RepID=UPI002D531C4E|nr:DUF4239 domain-containing protein [Methyloceanibacter sp.]HZP07828.1 DUF4239 domain-containing protein [Methyloceanibacter sp.]
MIDWLLNRPPIWMALIIFTATYLCAAVIFAVITGLARGERARAFKGLSPGMLPPLGIIFGLLVGFIAAQVWTDFEKAKIAVVNEASALRAVILLAGSFPAEQEARLRAFVDQHIDTAVNQEWPEMARQKLSLASVPVHLLDALTATLALSPSNDGQKLAQSAIVTNLEKALDARRQRIITSRSSVSRIKWSGLLLQALCTLVAIAMVHSDNRATCAIALTLFATGVAMSILLVGCYSRPFTGEISVGHELLDQVMTTVRSAAPSP